MKKFTFTLVFFISITLFSFTSFTQTVKTVGSGGDYSTLSSAFAAINNGNITGNIELQIISSHTTAAATLNASGIGSANYSSVLIYPTGSGYSITASINDNLISFSGADNITIDGRVNQSGAANLTISNTSTGTASSTIRFINSAENNIIMYCNITGASMNTSGGVIFFSTSTSGNGNSNNIISNNNISGTANRPVNLIYSSGVATHENINNTIKDNNIFNFFNASASSRAVNVLNFSSDWSIEGNSFYETSAFAPSANNLVYSVININNPSGNNFLIKDNFIGGKAISAGGAAWDFGSTGSLRSIIFYPIYVNVGSSIASSIQNNTIKNIDYYSSSATPWYAIYTFAGDVNIGNINGNFIGDTTGTNSVILNNTSTNTHAYAICTNSKGNVNISNNFIGSITTVGTTSRSYNFTAININANVTGNTIVNNNFIGSKGTSASINASANSTGNIGQAMHGIYNAGPGSATITNNSITNILNTYNGNNELSRTSGIYNAPAAGSSIIDNNTISKIYTYSKHSGLREVAGIAGIVQSSVVSGSIHIVTRNNISNISNLQSSNTSVNGIYYTSTSDAGNKVSRNLIHSLTSSSTSSSATVNGIYVYNSNAFIDNNIIVLGSNVSTDILLYGLFEEGLNSKIYHNTIYIQGTGNSTSYALFSNTSNTRDIRNNILFNARSNGSNYALGLSSISNLTIDYNDYLATGIGGVLSRIGSTNYSTLANLKTATGQDVNSYNVNPNFDNAGGTIFSDYYTDIIVVLNGASGTGVTVDYTGATRNTVPRIGALERNDFYWQGGTSTDFNTASNWLNNAVPSAGANIIFNANPDNHCLLDQNRIVGSVTNAQGDDLLFANGYKLTILGDLEFSNGAKINAETASSIIEIAGIEMQNIQAGSFVNNYADAFTLNNPYGFILQEDFTIQNDFTLTNGDYSIGDNTLTLNGLINITSGSLTGGDNSNLIIGGSGASTSLPQITLQNLTLDRANGISLSGNLIIQNELNLDDGVLVTAANTITVNGNVLTSDGGSIDASNSSANLIFNNTSAITLPAGVFSAPVNNLTINGVGLYASSDFTVNGILSLQNTNMSAVAGLLDMQDDYILTMGGNAITTGQGEVTGRVLRTDISANTIYTFGSENTTISFNAEGTLPDDVLFIIKIGQTHPIKTEAVERYYEIIQSSGETPNKFNLKLKYLDSELNSNVENKLVYWDHHVPYSGTSPHEHGKTIQDINENWMMMSEHGIRYLATEEYTGEVPYIDDLTTPPNKSKIWILAERETIYDYIWLGADDSDWNNVANWSGGVVPISTSDVYIPDSSETLYDPILPDVTEIKALIIEPNGVLYGGDNTVLTVNGRLEDNQGIPSWSNSGVFFPGTSTVKFTNGKSAIAGTTDFYNLVVPTDDSLRLIAGTTIRIAGELTVDGTLHVVLVGATTVEYNGDNQTVIIPNTSTNRYYNLILSGTGEKTMPTSAFDVLGDFSVQGTASATAGNEISFNGNIIIGEDAEFATGNYSHELLGNFENNGTFSSALGYSFEFNGTDVAQIISGTSASSFDILEVNNTNGVYMFADVNVDNNLALNTGNLVVGAFTLGINGTVTNTEFIEVNQLSSLSFGGTDAYVIPDDLFTNTPDIKNLTIDRVGGVTVGNQEFTINGTLALNDGEFDNSDKTLTIAGDITRVNGSLTTNSNTNLYFEEDLNLLILPDDMFTDAPSINNLKIYREGGIEMGNQDITVENILILTDGIINTGSSLIILTAYASVSTDGINSTPGSFDSHVDGCLRKIGNTAFVFPIGKAFRYSPLAISDADGGGNIEDYFTACYYDYNPELDLYYVDSVDFGLDNISRNEYWQLNRSGTNNVAVSLYWNSYSGIIEEINDMRIVKWNGTKWVSQGVASVEGSSSSGIIVSELVTSFSPFTFGSTSNDNVLPIELINFSGKANIDNIQLKWITATETNNDFFTLEKSLNLKDWNILRNIKGSGNSNSLKNYSHIDLEPFNGIQYYRLKQTDYDGQFEYSNTISVLFKKEESYKISLFPNPINDVLYVGINNVDYSEAKCVIYNSVGNVVAKQNFNYSNFNEVDVSMLGKGVYFVEIYINNSVERFKIIKI